MCKCREESTNRSRVYINRRFRILKEEKCPSRRPQSQTESKEEKEIHDGIWVYWYINERIKWQGQSLMSGVNLIHGGL